MFGNRMRRIRIAGLGAVLCLALVTSGTFAQPGPGGPHRGMQGGDPLAGVITEYKSQLALDTSQQGMWDKAVAATADARQKGSTLMQQVHDTMAAELAKAEPDLAAAAAVADDARAKGQVLRQQSRNAWLALYATFSPSQKAIVRDAMLQRMQRFEQMKQRFGKG